jgi:hypothetical protein
LDHDYQTEFNRLSLELQSAHDAVRDFESGQAGYEHMVEFRRRIAVKRAARARLDAHKANR